MDAHQNENEFISNLAAKNIGGKQITTYEMTSCMIPGIMHIRALHNIQMNYYTINQRKMCQICI
jgi:hypothetical protein